MKTLSIIYDDVHTKVFNINGKDFTFVYDFFNSKHIQDPDLSALKDGYYTYIIHDNHRLKVAPVCEFENGSKHIQLIQETAIQYTGGELCKKGDHILFNLQAGIFRDVNPYNLKYHSDELSTLLKKTFINHNAPQMIYTEKELINCEDFIKNGTWDIKNYKHIYH